MVPKITTIVQQRWSYKLLGFDFVVEYKRGKENTVADVLSRREEEGNSMGTNYVVSLVLYDWIEAIKEEVRSHPFLQQLVQRIKEGEVVGPWKFENNILFFKDKIFLAKDFDLITAIGEQFH